MQKVFENIIEMLEEEKNDLTDWAEDIAFGLGIRRSIEIVKRAAEGCRNGHFGCNTNGQHEKCSTCCDYDCKNRNREWFGLKDEEKKQTNADEIRSMSDEELAEFIEQISTDSMDTISFGTKDYEEIWEHKETALKWLQSEVEE